MNISNESSFQENGYHFIDAAFTLDELNAFKQILYQTVHCELKKHGLSLKNNSHSSLEDECDLGLLTLYRANPSYFLNVRAIISRSPEYYRLCSSPKIITKLRELLNRSQIPPLYLTNNGIIFTVPREINKKCPSSIEIDWHKDTFFTLPKSRYLHVWAPLLHNATEEIGTLMLCDGSHKEGIGKQGIDPTASYDHRYFVEKNEILKYPSKTIELKLGQALIFDGNLIHRSGRNNSKHIRCSLIGLYHDVSQEDFSPLSIEYRYTAKTPEGYFYDLFKDEKALPLIYDQASKNE
jgi:hypothetical protein